MRAVMTAQNPCGNPSKEARAKMTRAAAVIRITYTSFGR